MVDIKSDGGVVEIRTMEGTQENIVRDLGTACAKTLVQVATNGAKTKEEALHRNEQLIRQLVEFLNKSLEVWS